MCKTRTRIEQCNIQKEREQQRLFGVCCFYFVQRVNNHPAKETAKISLKNASFVLSGKQYSYFRFYFIELSNIMLILYICREKPI